MINHYKKLRNKYLPKKIKVIFILESPPSGHGYFYDENSRAALFRSFMEFIKYKPIDKRDGLKEFAKRGYLIVDPIYKPVNLLTDELANQMILNNYRNFKKDLKKIVGNRKIPIILVKVNICVLLEKRLLNDGFNVINNNIPIPFPNHFHRKRFLKILKKMLKI